MSYTEEFKKAYLKARFIYQESQPGQRLLGLFAEALQDNRQLQITYPTQYADVPKDFRFCPCCVKEYRREWYAIGLIPGQGTAYFTLALNDIQAIERTPDHFAYPENFNPEEHFMQILGPVLHHAGEQSHIKIGVRGRAALRIKARPLHPSQKLLRESEEYTVFEYHLCSSYLFLQELMSYAPRIEVLEPETLRLRLAHYYRHAAYLNAAAHQGSASPDPQKKENDPEGPSN